MEFKTGGIWQIVILFFLLQAVFAVAGCSLFDSRKQKAEHYYHAGVQALAAGNKTAALREFKDAVQENPHHSHARFELGKMHLAEGDLYRGLKELNQAMLDPDFKEVRELLAGLFYRHRLYERVVPLGRELLARYGEDEQIMLMLGDSLLGLGNIGEAGDLFSRMIARFPERPGPMVGLARVFRQQNNMVAARRLMEQAALSASADLPLQVVLAQFYEEIEDLRAAREKFSAILVEFPGESQAYLAKANFYIRQQQSAAALAVLADGLQNSGEPGRLYQARALIYHNLGDYPAALEDFQTVYRLSPGERQYSLMLADYHTFLQQYDDAADLFEQMGERWPNWALIPVKQAELMVLQGKFAAADRLIAAIARKYPDEARIHLVNGVLRLQQGEDNQARLAFDQARRLLPESAAANYYYGLSYLENNDFDAAKEPLLKALELEPDLPRSRLALAYIYYRTANFNLALIELDTLLTNRPDYQQARVLLAEVFTSVGNYRKAIEEYQAVSRQAPDHLEYQYRIAALYKANRQKIEALAVFLALMEKTADPLQPFEAAIGILLEQKNFTEAMRRCEQFQDNHGRSLESDMIKTRILLAGERNQDGVSYLNEIINRYPEAMAPQLLMADLLLHRGDCAAAVTIYEKAAGQLPMDRDVLMKLAFCYITLDQISKAAATYETLLTQYPDYGPAANDLAFLYADNGYNLIRALDLAVKAMQLMPEDPGVSDTLGWVYFQKGAARQAVNHLRNAVNAMPELPIIRYHLGEALWLAEDYNAAGGEYEKAAGNGLTGKELAGLSARMETLESWQQQIAAAEEYARSGDVVTAQGIYGTILQEAFYLQAALGLAKLYADEGVEQERALELAAKAFEMYPEDPAAADILGWVYFKNGSLLMAKKYLRQASRSSGNPPLADYHLAQLFIRESNFREAHQALQKALDGHLPDPEGARAAQLLKEIEAEQ